MTFISHMLLVLVFTGWIVIFSSRCRVSCGQCYGKNYLTITDEQRRVLEASRSGTNRSPLNASGVSDGNRSRRRTLNAAPPGSPMFMPISYSFLKPLSRSRSLPSPTSPSTRPIATPSREMDRANTIPIVRRPDTPRPQLATSIRLPTRLIQLHPAPVRLRPRPRRQQAPRSPSLEPRLPSIKENTETE